MLSTLQEQKKEVWDAAVSDILEQLRTSPTKGGRPYDHGQNVFEREFYRLICRLIDRSEGYDIIEAAVIAHCSRNPRDVTLKANPFFWGLKAVAQPAELKAFEISRRAKIMLYAHRHEISPDLFTGFVMQTGRTTIYQTMPSAIEPWFADKRVALASNAPVAAERD